MTTEMLFLISGHNGEGTGANSSFLDEGKETIVLRNLIALNLTRLGCLDYTTDDDTDNLNTVISKLKQKVKKDDILIDIHFNSATETANGTEIFIPTDYSPEEKSLAENLLKTVCDTLGTKSRGVKVEGQSQHSRLAILHLPCHTVLVEVCFLTNKSDVYKYKESREKLAENISILLLKRINYDSI